MKKINYYGIRTIFTGGVKKVETCMFGHTGEYGYNHNGEGMEILPDYIDFEKYVKDRCDRYKDFNRTNMWKWEIFLTDCPKDIYCDDWSCLNNKIRVL